MRMKLILSQISLEIEKSIDRISRMLKDIGHRLMILNENSQNISDLSEVKPPAVEINGEIMTLSLNFIMTFRTESLGTFPKSQLNNDS
jgi:hypothetical protein